MHSPVTITYPNNLQEAIQFIHAHQFFEKPQWSNYFTLSNYQSRTGAEETGQAFLAKNYTSFKLQKQSKQDYSFLYIINGSGFGKTWFGRNIPSHLQTCAPHSYHINVYLDFSSDHRWNALFDSISPSISIGIRVAAQLFFSTSLTNLADALIAKYGIKFELDKLIRYFAFQNVLSMISSRFGQQEIVMTIHMDSMHNNPTFSQNILQTIATYMCSSDSMSHNICLFPIISGTSSKGLKVANTCHYYVQLQPFTWTECIERVQIRCSSLVKYLQFGIGKRLLKGCGGIPRLVDYLISDCEALLNYIEKGDWDYVKKRLIENIKAAYKPLDWEEHCYGYENLQKLLILSMTRATVSLNEKLPKGGVTIEDVMKNGVCFVTPTHSQQAYYIVFPQLLLSVVSDYILPKTAFDVSELFPRYLHWNQLEELEAKFDAFKSNLYYLGGVTDSSFGKYYCGTYSKSLLNCNFLITPVPTAEARKFCKYATRCAQALDTYVVRLPLPTDPIPIPWMFCKQLKHNTNEAYLSVEYLQQCISKFAEEIVYHNAYFRVVFIIVADRPTTKQDRELAISTSPLSKINLSYLSVIQLAHTAIISREELEEYTSMAFSSFSVFEDDSQFAQDYSVK